MCASGFLGSPNLFGPTGSAHSVCQGMISRLGMGGSRPFVWSRFLLAAQFSQRLDARAHADLSPICVQCCAASEKPINGKTLHEGVNATDKRPKLTKFTAMCRKQGPLVAEKGSIAPQQCPLHKFEASMLGFIAALLFMHPNVQCKW